jgi:hypothetical protein
MSPEVRPDCEFHPDTRPGRFIEEDPALQRRKAKGTHRRDKKMPERPDAFVEPKGPRESCTGCANHQICEYPCKYMEENHLPAREVSNAEYAEYWRRAQTQYVLDHADDIPGKRWRFIMSNYFRKGWLVDKIARKLRIDESVVEREIEHIVAYCWSLDKWRNLVRCVRTQMGTLEEDEAEA